MINSADVELRILRTCVEILKNGICEIFCDSIITRIGRDVQCLKKPLESRLKRCKQTLCRFFAMPQKQGQCEAAREPMRQAKTHCERVADGMRERRLRAAKRKRGVHARAHLRCAGAHVVQILRENREIVECQANRLERMRCCNRICVFVPDRFKRVA